MAAKLPQPFCITFFCLGLLGATSTRMEKRLLCSSAVGRQPDGLMLDCTATSPQITPKCVLNILCHMRALLQRLLALDQVDALGIPAISLRSTALPPNGAAPSPQTFHAMHKPQHHRIERELHDQGATPWRAEAHLVGGEVTLKPKVFTGVTGYSTTQE